MNPLSSKIWSWIVALAIFPFDLSAEKGTSLPKADSKPWMITFFGGKLTDDRWESSVNLVETDWIDSYIAGLALARDFASHGNFRFGWEIQVVYHFGMQDHFEGNGLIYTRYELPADWKIFKSLSFGIGLSFATEIPESEIDRGGDSTNALVYWMGEIEFYLPPEELTLILRLHHRSDGYGLFPEDTGTNAIVVGLRWSL